MNITSKSRYALKIMRDLCGHWAADDNQLIQRGDIAARQGIPLDYMDHILSRLREAGLIASTRGRSGGYRLAQLPMELTVLAIFTAVEDNFEPVQCLEGGTSCMAEHVCSSKDAWGVFSSAIRAALSGIILEDLVHQRGIARGLEFLTMTPQECRAPKRRAGGTN